VRYTWTGGGVDMGQLLGGIPHCDIFFVGKPIVHGRGSPSVGGTWMHTLDGEMSDSFKILSCLVLKVRQVKLDVAE